MICAALPWTSAFHPVLTNLQRRGLTADETVKSARVLLINGAYCSFLWGCMSWVVVRRNWSQIQISQPAAAKVYS
jgi:hypothetical protein